MLKRTLNVDAAEAEQLMLVVDKYHQVSAQSSAPRVSFACDMPASMSVVEFFCCFDCRTTRHPPAASSCQPEPCAFLMPSLSEVKKKKLGLLHVLHFPLCWMYFTPAEWFHIRNGILLQQSPKIPRRHLGYSTLQWLDLYIVTPSGALVTDHFSPPSLSWAAASIFLQLFSNCAVPISDYTALLQVFHCCRVLRVAVSVGSRAFPAAASSVWNSLPDNVASASTLDFSTRP